MMIATVIVSEALICGLVWLRLFARARRTTLVPAAWWTLLTVVALAATCWFALSAERLPNSPERINVRFLTAVLSFCPLMAVLGARKPHHRAWQWIVLTLWAILALPVAEAYVVQRGAAVKIHDARGIFLWAMVLAGLANYGLTRFTMPAMLVTAAQVVLLVDHLPGLRLDPWAAAEPVALSLITLALLLTLPARRHAAQLAPHDRVWLDYRDAFGTLWALRMLERLNAYGDNYQWPVRLGWWGFHARPVDGNSDASDAAHPAPHHGLAPTVDSIDDRVRRSWWSLLRRFVDEAWFLSHWEGGTAREDDVSQQQSPLRHGG